MSQGEAVRFITDEKMAAERRESATRVGGGRAATGSAWPQGSVIGRAKCKIV